MDEPPNGETHSGTASPTNGLHDIRARLAGVAVAIVVAAVVGMFLLRPGDSAHPPTTAASSTDPAHFDLPQLGGPGRVRLADFRGRPVVVNFFASWCTACRGELPGFRRVAQEMRGRVGFVGVNSQETGDGLAFARENGIGSWPLARDVEGTQDSGLHDALGARGLPITAFYDASGRLLTVHLGAFTEEALRAKLQEFYK